LPEFEFTQREYYQWFMGLYAVGGGEITKPIQSQSLDIGALGSRHWAFGTQRRSFQVTGAGLVIYPAGTLHLLA